MIWSSHLDNEINTFNNTDTLKLIDSTTLLSNDKRIDINFWVSKIKPTNNSRINSESFSPINMRKSSLGNAINDLFLAAIGLTDQRKLKFTRYKIPNQKKQYHGWKMREAINLREFSWSRRGNSSWFEMNLRLPQSSTLLCAVVLSSQAGEAKQWRKW